MFCRGYMYINMISLWNFTNTVFDAQKYILGTLMYSLIWSFFHLLRTNLGWFTDNILITSFIQKHKNTVTFQKPKKTLLPVIKVRERTNCLRCCVPALGWQELFLFICQECDNIPLFAFPCCFLICYIPHLTLPVNF